MSPSLFPVSSQFRLGASHTRKYYVLFLVNLHFFPVQEIILPLHTFLHLASAVNTDDSVNCKLSLWRFISHLVSQPV